MKRIRLASSAVAAVAAAALVIGTAPGALALPAPPNSSSLTRATNALLQAKALSAAGGEGAWMAGYFIPPGGQDPLPFCTGGGTAAVAPTRTGATGYISRMGSVEQDVYSYASPAIAERAWEKFASSVTSVCTGSVTNADTTYQLTTGSLTPSGPVSAGIWAREDAGQFGVGRYAAGVLSGNAIIFVTRQLGVPASSGAMRNAINGLVRTGADRWANRLTAPISQNPVITAAEASMFQPADATLPITSPARGGWSSFNANLPGFAPWTCDFSATVPAGPSSFVSDSGGTGGVVTMPGSFTQRVSVYSTTQAAKLAWAKLRPVVIGCNDAKRPALSQTESVSWTSAGQSALSFEGTPGVWSRDVETSVGGTCADGQGNASTCNSFTMKNYTIHLLVGRSISSLTYYATRPGVRNFSLDQARVNALAETLANRLAAAVK